MAEKYSRQSEDVMAYAAASAALKTKGVGSLCSAPMSFSLRSREKYRGIVMSIDEGSCVFDVYLNIKYASSIPQTAFAVQEAVKRAVEAIVDIEVSKVHIHIMGTDFDQPAAADKDLLKEDF